MTITCMLENIGQLASEIKILCCPLFHESKTKRIRVQSRFPMYFLSDNIEA